MEFYYDKNQGTRPEGGQQVLALEKFSIQARQISELENERGRRVWRESVTQLAGILSR